jgi:HD-like signal output (HDOD) protein
MTDNVDKFISSLLNDLKRNQLKLPTLPQVALKVSEVIDNPESRAKDVAKIISKDAALSTRLIQMANSAMYRGTSHVEDVQTAVARLGLKLIRNMVTSLLIKQLFHTRYDKLKNRMELLWFHSTLVGAISFVLASKYTSLKADEAMLSGLVHDIGALPIIAYAEKFPDIANDEQILDQIIEKIGPILGKTMLQTWHFSPDLVAVAAECKNLQRQSDKVDYTAIVMVANLHSYLGSKHPLGKVNWPEIPAFKSLGLTPDESINTLQEAKENIREIQQMLVG